MTSNSLYPFRMPEKLLRNFGIWRENDSTWKYHIYGLLMHLIMLDNIAFCQTMYMLKATNFKNFIDVLSVILTIYSIVFKTIIFTWKLQEAKSLMNALKDLLKFSSDNEIFERIMLKNQLDRIIKIYKFYYWSAIVACTASGLVPVIQYKNQRLPYEIWFYFDHEKNVGGFWFLCVYQYLMSMYAAAIGYSIDIFPVIFMCYIIGMIKELTLRIDKIGSRMKEFKILEAYNFQELRKCIEIHSMIKKILSKIEHQFSAIILVQGFLNSVTLCSSAFMLTLVSFIMDFKQKFIVMKFLHRYHTKLKQWFSLEQYVTHFQWHYKYFCHVTLEMK